MIKKLLASAAALMLLSGCSLDLIKNEIDPPVRPEKNTKPDFEESLDEMHETLWYYEACLEYKMGNFDFEVDERIGNRDLKKGLNAMRSEYPEIFWWGGSFSAVTATRGARVEIDPPAFIEEYRDDLPKMLEEVESAAWEIAQSVPKDASEYEKVLYVHDYLINHTVYDHDGADEPGRGMYHTSYGCLVEGKAVCEGYAAAFSLIMDDLGIESGMCTGSNHAWNYVKVDGEYYWIDVTWDDTDKGEDQAVYTYFLINDDLLLNTRTFDLEQAKVPECTSLDNNYFVKNGAYFEEYDEEAVLEYVSSAPEGSRCGMMFGSFEVYEEALNALIRDLHLRKADGVDVSKLMYRRYDNMFILTIDKGDIQ